MIQEYLNMYKYKGQGAIKKLQKDSIDDSDIKSSQ